MNPGVVEETGQTARAGIGALASTPALLALIFMQLFTTGAVTYSIYNRQNATNMIMHKLIEQCGPRQTQAEEPLPLARNFEE
jgi:hypothetical protein